MEDHNVQGGLGGAVSEVLARCCPTLMAMVETQYRFCRSGDPEELAKLYGIDSQPIADSAMCLLGR